MSLKTYVGKTMKTIALAGVLGLGAAVGTGYAASTNYDVIRVQNEVQVRTLGGNVAGIVKLIQQGKNVESDTQAATFDEKNGQFDIRAINGGFVYRLQHSMPLNMTDGAINSPYGLFHFAKTHPNTDLGKQVLEFYNAKGKDLKGNGVYVVKGAGTAAPITPNQPAPGVNVQSGKFLRLKTIGEGLSGPVTRQAEVDIPDTYELRLINAALEDGTAAAVIANGLDNVNITYQGVSLDGTGLTDRAIFTFKFPEKFKGKPEIVKAVKGRFPASYTAAHVNFLEEAVNNLVVPTPAPVAPTNPVLPPPPPRGEAPREVTPQDLPDDLENSAGPDGAYRNPAPADAPPINTYTPITGFTFTNERLGYGTITDPKRKTFLRNLDRVLSRVERGDARNGWYDIPLLGREFGTAITRKEIFEDGTLSVDEQHSLAKAFNTYNSSTVGFGDGRSTFIWKHKKRNTDQINLFGRLKSQGLTGVGPDNSISSTPELTDVVNALQLRMHENWNNRKKQNVLRWTGYAVAASLPFIIGNPETPAMFGPGRGLEGRVIGGGNPVNTVIGAW